MDADKRRLVDAPVSQHDYLLFVIVIKPYKDLLAYHILDDLDQVLFLFLLKLQSSSACRNVLILYAVIESFAERRRTIPRMTVMIYCEAIKGIVTGLS